MEHVVYTRIKKRKGLAKALILVAFINGAISKLIKKFKGES
jgi:hypothetical protein